jgi:hypothetical protein
VQPAQRQIQIGAVMTTGDTPSDTKGTKPTWLFMVYMEASDTTNLDSLGVLDLVELQQAIQGTKDPTVGSNHNVAAIVQMKRDWPDVPQRYFIAPHVDFVQTQAINKLEDLVSPLPTTTAKLELRNVQNMAVQTSLESFLSAGRAFGEKLQVTHYCLVLWGHNFGLGFGRDDGQKLTPQKIKAALESQKFSRPGSQPADEKRERLHLLATNSCTMAYIEAAFELRNSVQYMVASQVFMPARGFPYRPIVRSIGAATQPKDLGIIFLDEYMTSFANSPNGEKVALSLLNLDGAEQFAELLSKTAGAIKDVIRSGSNPIDQKRLREIQDVFMVNPAGDARPVIDLNGLAQSLVMYCQDNGVDPARASFAANGLGAFSPLSGFGQRLDRLTQKVGTPGPRTGMAAADVPTLVVDHKEHPDLAPLGGIGVFATFVVDGAARKQLELAAPEAQKLYRELQIFSKDYHADKRWPVLVDDTLRRDEPDEIVSATGVVEVADRVQVNQLVGAIDAAFNNLDRILTSIEALLVPILALKPERPKKQRGKEQRSRSVPSKDLPFGPPYLKLARDLSLQSQKSGKPALLVSKNIVLAFARVEAALSVVERTVKNVMTNSSFGLGPPVKSDVGALGPKSDIGALGPKSDIGALGPKSDIGALGPKSDIGALGPKSDIGALGPKSDIGALGPADVGALWGAMTAFLSSDTQVAMLSLRVLYCALATVLVDVEVAISNLELSAAQCQLEPGFADALSDEQYKSAMEQRFARLFAVAGEAALIARRTTRTIMSHPVYGLGPGPDGFGQAQRDQLAATSGLSRSQLALLLVP